MVIHFRRSGLFVALLLTAGCQPEFTTLTVRFGQVPQPVAYAQHDDRAAANLAVHRPIADGDIVERDRICEPDGYAALENVRVGLWGGAFAGDDVTGADVPLDPGNYTFVHRQSSEDEAIWGVVLVNVPGDDLTDVFRRWKAEVPKQRRRLAYRFEATGSARNCDAALLRTLESELQAVDKFERRLEEAIARESNRRAAREDRDVQLAAGTVVRLFDDKAVAPERLTQPLFAEVDLERVRSGETVTKVLLTSAYADIRDRLTTVGELTRDLRRCRDTARDEVRRLEGRKRLHAMIFSDESQYEANQQDLQDALADEGKLNDRLADLRDRQLTLAFAAELALPSGARGPLDDAHRDLAEDRAVLEAERIRLEALHRKAGMESYRRVALQHRLQRLERALTEIGDEWDVLAEASESIEQMRESSTVIYRQGVGRVLAAGFVEESVPPRLRDALVRESLMTVRLQACPRQQASTGRVVAQR